MEGAVFWQAVRNQGGDGDHRRPICSVSIVSLAHDAEYRGSYWCCLDFGNLGNVVLVIDTVAQHIAEIPQSTFQGICCAFFFGFFESCRLALAVLNMSIANIL